MPGPVSSATSVLHDRAVFVGVFVDMVIGVLADIEIGVFVDVVGVFADMVIGVLNDAVAGFARIRFGAALASAFD